MNQGGKLLFLDATESTADTPDTTATPAADEALATLARLLRTEGFNPVTQLAGYLTTEDPTYLPEDVAARALARRVGRDKLLEVLIEGYLATHPTTPMENPSDQP